MTRGELAILPIKVDLFMSVEVHVFSLAVEYD